MLEEKYYVLRTIDTLTQREPESMLAAMFSGRHSLKLEKGYVLIDRDGDYFGYILNWLRDGFVPALEAHTYKQLLKVAEYFELLGLIDGIQISDLTRSDAIKCIQSKERRFRGVTDLRHACLRNVSFSGANLTESMFHNADLQSANLNHAILALTG